MAGGRTFLTTPVAILLAGVAVGVGLYAGLWTQTPESSPVAPRTLPGPDGRPAPVRRITKEDASAQATTALRAVWESRHGAVVQACWAPIAAGLPAETQLSYTLEAIFGADGKLLMEALQEARVVRGDVTTSHPAFRSLGTCVQRQLGVFSIPPPGLQVRVTIPVTLP